MIALILAQLYNRTLNNHSNHYFIRIMICVNAHNIISENRRIQYCMYNLSVIWNHFAPKCKQCLILGSGILVIIIFCFILCIFHIVYNEPYESIAFIIS